MILAASALSLVGCIGTDESADRYIKQANEIQEEGLAESKTFAEALRNASTPGEFETAIELGIDANEDVLAGFEDLNPPPEVRDEHERILEMNERSTELAQNALDAFRTGSRSEFLAAAEQLETESISMQDELPEIIDRINTELDRK